MKREPEELDALVAGALRRLGPVTAQTLSASLRERGHPMTEAQAYRVLKRLIGRGEARHIWLSRSYAAREPSEQPLLVLVCHRCGGASPVACREVDQGLRSAAAAAHFSVDEIILEASGLCGGCRAGVEGASQEAVL